MTTHHILPGSSEMDGTVVKAAVHTGPSEWTPQNLRYVQADISAGKKGDSVLSFLANVYDNRRMPSERQLQNEGGVK